VVHVPAEGQHAARHVLAGHEGLVGGSRLLQKGNEAWILKIIYLLSNDYQGGKGTYSRVTLASFMVVPIVYVPNNKLEIYIFIILYFATLEDARDEYF